MSSPEVYRGHFDECLRHYSARTQEHVPKGSKQIGRIRRPMAAFCRVTTKTVGMWFSGIVPNGTNAIRAMCFLDSKGYRVIELEEMPQTRRHLVELIGYSMLSAKEVATALDIAHEDQLLKVLRTMRPMQDDREQKVWAMFKSHKDALEEKKLHLTKPQKRTPIPKRPAEKKALVELVHSPTPVGAHKAPELRGVFTAMQLLLQLLEGGAGEILAKPDSRLDAAERRMILQLSMQLSALSSQILLRESTKEVGDGKS